jgi:hypothetical protein
MSEVYTIFAVTFIIINMKRSYSFYSKVPDFELVYGGSIDDPFTTYQIGKRRQLMYLNLELEGSASSTCFSKCQPGFFGRINFLHGGSRQIIFIFCQ